MTTGHGQSPAENGLHKKVDWMPRERFIPFCQAEGVDLLSRLLLLSDGTVTHFLEAILLETVSLELIEQSEVVISDDDAKRLLLPKGEKGINRIGWLTVAHKKGEKETDFIHRRVYVSSILPIARMFPSVYQEILFRKKPLGRIISEQNLTFRRDHVEIGRFRLPEIARGFGLSSDTPLWARRSCLALLGAQNTSGILFEAISPFFPSPSKGENIQTWPIPTLPS